jgi:hypothetical protein
VNKIKLKKQLLLCLLSLAIISTKAQTKIKDGTVASTPALPAANSLLELESNNKGLLFPRVALTATNVAAPLSAHIAGMTVYNTATAGTTPFNVVPALYYNDGTKWLKVIANAQTLDNVTITNPTAFTVSGSFYDYKFQTESNDILNEYNPATGVFTVARTGIYTLTLSNLGTCSSGQVSYAVFFSINGNLYAGSNYTGVGAAGGNFTSSGSITLQLNAGDVVFPRGFNIAGLSCSLSNSDSRTFMSIVQIR